MISFAFSGRTALITGAGSGIGRSIAIAFSQAGARTVVAGRRLPELEETVRMIGTAGGEAVAIAADVANERSVSELIRDAGPLHLAVNAAGIVQGGSLDDMNAEAFERVFDVNVTGLWLAMKHEIRAMKASGGGAIVNIGSNIGARIVRPGMGAYAASKAAVSSLTRTAALEAVEHGIRINCLCPGPTDTPLSMRPGEDRAARDARVAATNPSKRVAATDEIAAATLWLASDEAAYIVGQDIVIDGGASA
ncbi:NAD(P)-dependent dehydrogenase (short-subunit alcohol dehydrogenase family) [Pseudaminobacter salicylatoxidans]|uniref:NAD(P)-dependent dehydrogenase (Short-subunit alcohol dehydrogenase family) n=1 Tax=Pseudaminobacter salicylatoxidans TaxID=93369 RepID=A0A316C481_PSESE|nr:SDR family oxidoreductase [Pseudaminobacter salicylatoxidans]PWJ84572.1 NAD(P)-dependent dehydrogenase (short-subunit alcohol dehydrogenase family) [Pseudaminobacter salicylatoxidans]